jgi:hypothetical protein
MTAHLEPNRLKIVVWCVVVLLLFLAASFARSAAAQSLLPVQGLTFGVLQPGSSGTVSPDDQGRAVIDVIGSGTFSILFAPPPSLASLQGHAIPLEFNPGDALLRWKNGNEFPLIVGGVSDVNVPRGQAPGVIHIGGTARPGATQAPGMYTATLVLQIVPSGV